MKNPAPNFHPEVDSALINALLTSSRDGIFLLNAHGDILHTNTNSEAILGATRENLVNRNLSTLIVNTTGHPPFSLSTATQPAGTLTIRGMQALPLQVNFTITRIANHDTTRYLFLFYPAPATLTDSVKHLQIIFENAQEGFVLIDAHGIIQAFNAKATESIIFGRADAVVKTGSCIYDFLEDDRKVFFRQVVAGVLGGELFKYEKDYVGINGSTRWFHFSLAPVHEAGVIKGVCITGVDVSDLKVAEQALVISRQKFRGLVEHSGDAVTIFSAEGIPSYISPSFSCILGYTEEEALRTELFSIVHPEDLPFVKKAWEKILASPGRTFFSNRCRIRHADGSWRWMDGTLTNLLHEPAIGGIVDNFRDVTELINSLTEQRLAVDRYRYLFNHNPVPMWIYEPTSLRFLEVNDAAIHRYGYSRNEFLNMTLRNIRSGNDIQKLQEAVECRAGKAYNKGGTWLHRTKSGEKIYVEISSHDIVHDGTGGILVLAHDVTERTKALDLLNKSYEEKTNILESLPNGFLRLDHSWTVTYWNKEAERILGISRSAILGTNIWDLFPSATGSKFYTESHRSLSQNEHVSFEEYLPVKEMWMDVSTFPSEDGLSLYFKDITDRKLIQETTRLAKERYDMVSKATNDVIYEWDIIKDVNYWGEGYETLFGYEKSGENLPSETWRGNLHPDEREELLRMAGEAFRDKKTSISREMRFRCADGNYKTVFDNLIILYNSENQPMKMVGAMQDITTRKEQEKAVNELNKTLNIRAEELARSNEELERFAYVASHDLQEPLRMVSSFLQLLQKNYKSGLDERANRYIDFAVDGAARMRKLILDLLAYSQVSNRQEKHGDVDPNLMMEAIRIDLESRIRQKNVELLIDPLPKIFGNEMQVNQLFRNFISNAIKYNNSEQPRVHVGWNDLGDRIEFFVADNGIGIEPQFMEKIFVIFQRLHQKNEYSGTGIGLAICKKIVDLHGGKIRIGSTPGLGSTFYFTLFKQKG